MLLSCFTSPLALYSLVNSFGLNGRGLEAVHLFEQIPRKMRDDVSHVTVLNACSHCGLLNQARTIFEQIPNKTKRITTTMVCLLPNYFGFLEQIYLLYSNVD